MGWPLIMYLSRSKTVSIWPELGRKKHDDTSFQGVKSSLNLSLTPKIDVTAEWKKRQDAPVPTRGKHGPPWPPGDSKEIVLAIEKLLRKTDSIGSMADFKKGTFEYPTYKLSGLLTINQKQKSKFRFGPMSMTVHGLTGRLKLTGCDIEVSVELALENIAGVDFIDGRWHVWESGTMSFFRDASASGYPLAGLFAYEGEGVNCFASCGIVYFISYRAFEREKNSLPKKLRDTISRGVGAWPVIPPYI